MSKVVTVSYRGGKDDRKNSWVELEVPEVPEDQDYCSVDDWVNMMALARVGADLDGYVSPTCPIRWVTDGDGGLRSVYEMELIVHRSDSLSIDDYALQFSGRNTEETADLKASIDLVEEGASIEYARTYELTGKRYQYIGWQPVVNDLQGIPEYQWQGDILDRFGNRVFIPDNPLVSDGHLLFNTVYKGFVKVVGRAIVDRYLVSFSAAGFKFPESARQQKIEVTWGSDQTDEVELIIPYCAIGKLGVGDSVSVSPSTYRVGIGACSGRVLVAQKLGGE